MRYWNYLILCSLLLATPAHTAQLDGRVLNIIAGDRLEIRATNERTYAVRLKGIESPQANTPAGRIAKKHLNMLVAGQTVSVEYSNIDRRATLIGKVMLGGSDVNLRQVTDGMAKTVPVMLGVDDKQPYQSAEIRARHQRLGIWGLSKQTLRKVY